MEEEALAGSDHHLLGERLELRRDAPEDPLRHLATVGVAVHLPPCRLPDARLCGARPVDDRVRSVSSTVCPKGTAPPSPGPPPRGPARARGRRAARGRAPAPRRGAPRPGRCPRGRGSTRPPPAAVARFGPAGRCAARPPAGSRAGRTGRAGGRTRSCAPRRRTRSRRGGSGPSARRNCATSMSRRAEDSSSWKTPVATWARRLSSARTHSSVSRWATNTSVFSPALAPPRGVLGEPGQAWIDPVGMAGLPRQSRSSLRSRTTRRAAPEASARRTRSALCRRPRACGAGASRTASTRARRSVPAAPAPDRNAHAWRQAPDVLPPRGAGARRQGLGPRQSGLEGLVLGEVAGAEQLEQAEEPVHVVVEGDRGEKQEVPPGGGDRAPPRARPGLPGWPGGRRSRWASSTTRRSMPASRARAVSSGRCNQRLEGHDRARVGVEGVEAGAVVPRHVGEAVVVEEDEHLVVLPPQLAQPLHGQGLRRHHEAALRAPRPHEVAQDQAGLDRLAEAHLVGQQPAYGIGGGGALRRVKLVGKEPDASAEEGAEPVRLAQRGQMQRIEAEGQVLDRIHLAGGEALHQVGPRVARARIVVGETAERRSARGQPQDDASGELHDDRSTLDGDDPPSSELRVVTVRQAVADLPHRAAFFHRVPLAARPPDDPVSRPRRATRWVPIVGWSPECPDVNSSNPSAVYLLECPHAPRTERSRIRGRRFLR